MNEKQLLAETAHLRAAVAQNIHQQRRIKVDEKCKMEMFTLNELQFAIKMYSNLKANCISMLKIFLNLPLIDSML